MMLLLLLLQLVVELTVVSSVQFWRLHCVRLRTAQRPCSGRQHKHWHTSSNINGINGNSGDSSNSSNGSSRNNGAVSVVVQHSELFSCAANFY